MSGVDQVRGQLERGSQFLKILEEHDFAFRVDAAGLSTGGEFARASFVRGSRRLELQFRQYLDWVIYVFGEHRLSHEQFIAAVAGSTPPKWRMREWWQLPFPRFYSDRMDGFRHLAADLAQHGAPFLAGTDDDLLQYFLPAGTRKRDSNG